MNLSRTRDEVADIVNKQLSKQVGTLTRQAAILLDRVSTLAERAETIQAETGRRLLPRRRPSRRLTVLVLLAGLGAGYAAAFFFDPERGRSRRGEIARRLGGVGLEANRIAQRTTVLAGDKAAGIKSRVTRSRGGETDDLTLLDRVESEVFRDPAMPKGDINVMVVEGRAVLRGQVPEPQIGAIEAAVRKVVGVKDVENLLHTPGTPAPQTAGPRVATGNGGSSGPNA